MAIQKDATQQRLDNAIYGTPKIKPDEQRKYLGTFRERVCLTITVAELAEQDWSNAITQELAKGIANQVLLNGNLPHQKLESYIKAISQANGHFTLKTEPQFATDDTALAIVVAASSAVNQSPVDVKKRYPQLINSATTKPDPNQAMKKQSLWQRIFHRKED